MEEAQIEDIDSYVEVFYEDKLELKVSAAKKILFLTLDLKNIDIILSHGRNCYFLQINKKYS